VTAVLNGLPVTGVRLSYGVFVPSGGTVARITERALPSALPLGSFMAVSGEAKR
jgi:hypothetical protein